MYPKDGPNTRNRLSAGYITFRQINSSDNPIFNRQPGCKKLDKLQTATFLGSLVKHTCI